MAHKTINNKPLHNKIPGLAKEAKEGINSFFNKKKPNWIKE